MALLPLVLRLVVELGLEVFLRWAEAHRAAARVLEIALLTHSTPAVPRVVLGRRRVRLEQLDDVVFVLILPNVRLVEQRVEHILSVVVHMARVCMRARGVDRRAPFDDLGAHAVGGSAARARVSHLAHATRLDRLGARGRGRWRRCERLCRRCGGGAHAFGPAAREVNGLGRWLCRWIAIGHAAHRSLQLGVVESILEEVEHGRACGTGATQVDAVVVANLLLLGTRLQGRLESGSDIRGVWRPFALGWALVARPEPGRGAHLHFLGFLIIISVKVNRFSLLVRLCETRDEVCLESRGVLANRGEFGAQLCHGWHSGARAAS